eukprot:g7979.t1
MTNTLDSTMHGAEDAAKQISASLVRGKGGLAEECQALLASYKERLSQGESGEKVDAEFRSTLQAMLETCDKRAKAELERVFKARRSKLPDAQKDRPKSAFRRELTRYTWSLCLADAVDRDQLRALKVHFKKTIEELWQVESSQSLAEQQARELFTQEWESFEEESRPGYGWLPGRFARTSKSQKQLAEEVCMVFNHVLRQHRHGDEALHVLELVPSTGLLGSETFVWEKTMNFLELRSSSRLQEFVAAHRTEKGHAPRTANETEMIRNHVVPELRRRISPMMTMEVEGEMPSEEKILDAMQRLNSALQVEENRFLNQQGNSCGRAPPFPVECEVLRGAHGKEARGEPRTMNNDDEELAAYQASISAQNEPQKSGAFERMKGDDPNWKVKTSEGQATLADIKKRRRDELEEAQEEGNFTSEDSAVVGEKTIISHYCSICGEHCVAADSKIMKLPRRRTDKSFALEESMHFHKKYANFGERSLHLSIVLSARILLKRPNGVEKQYRFYCRQCRQPLGYRPRPESETSKFSYFYRDALVDEQSHAIALR